VNDTFFLFDFGITNNVQKEENETDYQWNYQSILVDSNAQSASLNYSFFNSSEEEVEFDSKANDNSSFTVNPHKSSMQMPMSIDTENDEIIEISSSKKTSDKEIREKKFWTKNEDDLLLGYISKTQCKNWRLISDYIKSKSSQQCAYRYSKLLSDMNKKKWNRKDDIKLIELVEAYGQNWEIISNQFGDRSERDVETRFKEKLDPNVKNTKFSEEEDNEITRLYGEYGNDWIQIARHFTNRNAKMIKKRFQTYLKFTCAKQKKSRSKRSSFSSNVSLSTRSHSQISTPRSSQGPISRVSNETLNIEKEEEEIDVLSPTFFKIDLLSSFSNQVENIDKYFSQICLFYTEKSLLLEQAIVKSNKSGIEIDNIININTQVSNQVELLMSQVHQIHREKTTLMSEQACKLYIVKYIEIILQIIQQIKTKISLFQSF